MRTTSGKMGVGFLKPLQGQRSHRIFLNDYKKV